LACISEVQANEKIKNTLLFSTDIHLPPEQINVWNKIAHLLCTFIDKLDLDPELILNHPNLPSVLSYGTLAA
jgi:hypothetical protein